MFYMRRTCEIIYALNYSMICDFIRFFDHIFYQVNIDLRFMFYNLIYLQIQASQELTIKIIK